MMTRRVVMMAFGVLVGSALSASAQTPGRPTLIGLLKQSAKTVTVSPATTVVPVKTTTSSPTGGFTVTTLPILSGAKSPPPTECGPRPG